MNSMSVDTGRLSSLGSELVGHAGTYNADIDKIYGYINEVKGSWVGSDSTAFVNKVESCQAAIKSLGQVINEYGEFLISTSKAINQVIENNTIR